MAPRRPFVVDPVLTSIAIGYSNPAQAMIADRVLPRVSVGGEAFKWTEFPLGEAFTVPETEVGRKGQVNQVEFSGEERDGSVRDYGLDAPVPQSDIDVAAAARAQGRSNYDPEQHATVMLTKLVELDREVRVATRVQDPASYAAARRVALAGTDKLSDYANSDPIGVLDAAIDGTLIYRANTLVMGQPVWAKIKRHPKLVNAVKGNLTEEGIITKEQLADLLDIKEVLVGEAFVNTARPGQEAVLARAWGNSISALYIDPTARPEGEITYGFTAQFGTRVAGRIEDEDIGLQGGHRIRSGERIREVICAQDVGYLIQTPI
ncbi:capsid protein [Breoghania sp.]|uniref:capsid protein n=1 Tax=Breoghania sp. TaxID=2065378 RepID=UPI0029CA35E1|nr:capsid protein [Breoghania sp.]